MTDQDYIRNAVELADGFENQINEAGNYIEIHDVPYARIYLDVPRQDNQWVFDALAAQLVRQVDELSDYWVITRPHRTRIMAGLISGIFKEAEGPDRTMSTIKAIVDSEVLEAT